MARGKSQLTIKNEETQPKRGAKPIFTFESLRVDVRPKTENQKKFVKSIKNNIFTIGNGSPGTGKTYLAVAEAIKLLKDPNENYTRIILVKSVTVLDGESVGYLKGDLESKLQPIMYSFISNFYKIIGKPSTDYMLANGFIEPTGLGFLRGQSIDNAIIIADEFQNVTIENSKTLFTRVGTNTKLIVIGDSKQIDIKNKRLSSLDKICKAFEKVKEFDITYFTNVDQQRHPIINVIEKIFEEEIEPQEKSKHS